MGSCSRPTTTLLRPHPADAHPLVDASARPATVNGLAEGARFCGSCGSPVRGTWTKPIPSEQRHVPSFRTWLTILAPVVEMATGADDAHQSSPDFSTSILSICISSIVYGIPPTP